MDKVGKTCFKCGTWIKHSTNFHRHVKRCGTTEHRAQCPFCPKSYSRKKDLNKHIMQKHPPINGANAMMQICKRPKITYPRPCPKCGKELSRGSFFRHTKQCGTTEHRYHCPHCPLTFSQKDNLQRHVQQQHSKTPRWFTCPKCGKPFTTKEGMKVHLETVCAEVKSSYSCWFCNASFTRHKNRQIHMRLVHGRVCRDQDINLLLHLQRFSQEPDCTNEWMFVESRPIEADEPHICSCGQNNIKSYFFLENKLNGNRTFVGSTCIENIDERVGTVIAYFQYILSNPIQGTFEGHDSHGLQMFTVESNNNGTRCRRRHPTFTPPSLLLRGRETPRFSQVS